MASGKSSIGRLLSSELNMTFKDLDHHIVDKYQKSIADIFSEYGEIYFRKIEHDALKELLEVNENFILSLGGGTPCYANNMDLIASYKNATSIYLRANVNTISERLLKNKSRRPLVAELSDEKIPEFVAKHLFERRFFYEQADHVLSVDQKSKEEIIRNIAELNLF